MSKRVSKIHVNQVPASVALALLQEAANCGGQVSDLLAAAQLPCTLRELSDGSVKAIARAHFSLLSRECAAVFERHASGQGALPPMQREEFEMLCYSLINCKTLQEAILRAASFCHMLAGRAGKLALTRHADSAVFAMQTFRAKATSSALLADLLGLTAYHRLFSWLIGETIECAAMQIAYPPLLSAETLFDVFHYPVIFDTPQHGFEFAARYLDKPVVRSYQELLELLRFFPFDLVTTNLDVQRLDDAIGTLIKARMLQRQPLPTLAQLASVFNVSNATLRRRLDEEQTSISAIKDKCRREWARELLRESTLTFEEIADKLGFSDAGAFRRAFKNWTGTTPSDYRRALLEKMQISG